MELPRIKRNILFNPGPATTTDSVKYAMVVPDICPREVEFQAVLNEVVDDLVKIAGGDDYVAVLLAGSGTAAMDACVSSVVASGKKLCVINNGIYGERLCQIAQAYSIGLVEFSCPWHEQPDLNRLEQVVRSEPAIHCIAMVHHETTTGLLNPLAQVGALAKAHGKTYIVDAISSFAGIPFSAADNHIDYMVGTSNKCIQGIAGLSFVICRREAIEATAEYPLRSYYLNLYQQYKFLNETGQMQFTPPVQVIYALKQAIREFLEEGAEARYARYTDNWLALRRGLEGMGFECLLRAEQESHILTTVTEPDHPNYDFQTLHDLLLERGYTIYPGRTKGNKGSFRLSVIGDLGQRDINSFLDELALALDKMNVAIGTMDAGAAAK